ncbi:hypothetical protein [Streptomyces sp. CNQ431]|uniref:hypothetical protein n=1 Tax=Streptomyces sp. CNQ431 TaxID=1571532 RepID=UPI000B29F759|nr:hypothetical protein [Streptomyces sp. CNQ431]
MQSYEDLRDQLAAEAEAEAETARAAFEAAHGPMDRQNAVYGCHGSHGSPSVR